MTAPSDPVDLAEVRVLLAGATSGPWETWCAWSTGVRFTKGNGYGLILAPSTFASAHHAEYQANARLIAAAPTLLAELADEVERLRGDVARVRGLCEPPKPTMNDQCAHCGDQRLHHDGGPAFDTCSLCGFCGGFAPVTPKVDARAILAALDPPAQADTEEGGHVRDECCSAHWWQECNPANKENEDDNYTGPCCPRCPWHSRPEVAVVSEVELSRITIRRFLTDDGKDLVAVDMDNGQGEDLAVVESLGLLQLAIYDVCNRSGGDDTEEGT